MSVDLEALPPPRHRVQSMLSSPSEQNIGELLPRNVSFVVRTPACSVPTLFATLSSVKYQNMAPRYHVPRDKKEIRVRLAMVTRSAPCSDRYCILDRTVPSQAETRGIQSRHALACCGKECIEHLLGSVQLDTPHLCYLRSHYPAISHLSIIKLSIV